MTLPEITKAVDNDKTVCWESDNYHIVPAGYRNDYNSKAYDIKCQSNNNRIGLTWADGKTLNGKPEQFFIKEGSNE
jgi:hypothetical protein